MADFSGSREVERDRCLAQWSRQSGVALKRLDSEQRWLLFAALTFLSFAGGVTALRRIVGYFLAHCGAGFGSSVIGAVVDRSERAVRKTRAHTAAEFWEKLRSANRGHAPPKLRRDQVGLVAKFLAENKQSSVADLLGFIEKRFSVQMDRLTLRRFLKRYGLGCLREDSVKDTPFLPAAPCMVAPLH